MVYQDTQEPRESLVTEALEPKETEETLGSLAPPLWENLEMWVTQEHQELREIEVTDQSDFQVQAVGQSVELLLSVVKL